MTKKLLAGCLALCLCLLCACAGPEDWTPKPYLEIDGAEVEDPSLDKLRKGLEGLDSTEDSYVYLELAQPLDGVWYLSAALPLAEYEDGLGYILEACAEDANGGYSYLQYRTLDKEELLGFFEPFYKGKSAPDLSGWEDISDWYYDDYGGYDYDDGYDYDYGGDLVAPV